MTGTRKTLQRVNADITLSTVDAAHVVAVQFALAASSSWEIPTS
jgi:hypothetical protein